MDVLELTVSGIYDNYIDNYCIVSPETIAAQWGETPKQQMAFVSVRDGNEIHAVSAAVTDLDCVLNVSISEDMANMVGNMMAALDLVVMVAVLSAALLAVIVLYNLTNININERIREIATIKVLGFNAGEPASYVFKENMVLTVAGSIFGLGLGRLLLEFIMMQVKIDMVWFRTVLTPTSCILAVVLTLLSAVMVEFMFYFKLEKINMAEALKSVE
jgi:putative ABC transport system permease protein